MTNGDKMAIFEQYPEYAMRTNKKGERETKPWVSGPSPLAMGLLAGGLGILSQPEDTSGWVTEGGEFDPTNIARGGLLGLQAYQDQNKNLQGQRKDFYTHLTEIQDQAIQTQKFNDEQMDREEKKKKFPGMIRELRALDNPAITAKLNTLAITGQGDIDSAYNTAYNLLSAVSKQWEKPELVNGSLFQKSKDGEWKYITTPTASTTKLKLSAPEVTGQLFNAGTKIRLWEDTGFAGSKEGMLHPIQYNKLYREKQRAEIWTGDTIDKEGRKTSFRKKFEIPGEITPEDYAVLWGLDPSQVKRFEIDSPLTDTSEMTSARKKSITEAKDMGKVGIIARVEDHISRQTFDPTKLSMEQYGQYFTGGALPITGEARSYENMALAGSRMFGYLFSGATVKDDENRAMRTVLYPMPGDGKDDVLRKAEFRRVILDMYKTYVPEDVGKVIFSKIKNNKEKGIVTTVDEIEEVVKASEFKKSPVLTKAESATTLEKIW